MRKTIERQELNELFRANTQQAQLRQKKHFDKHCEGPKAYEVGDWVWVFCRIIPAGGTAKLLRGWRGPFKVTEVHQGGRYYHLSNGYKAHYGIMKPHHSGIEEFELSMEGDQQLVNPNPIAPELKEQLIMDDLSTVEVEVGELTPFEMEDLNEKADEIEQDRNNLPDAPFEMKTRGRRRSYNSESSISTDSDDSDGQSSCKIPGESSDDDATIRETDFDATEVNFTSKPIPGYQVIQGDFFQCRRQKRKGHTYALAHCISADATMGAGIAVTFCEHFERLRHRVESEAKVKASLSPIQFEEDNCWVYNLVTKQYHFDLPERRDLLDCLIQMKEHALANQVLEIHMPRLGAGLDCLEWKATEQMILEVFKNQALRLTVYEHNPPKPRRKQTRSKTAGSEDGEATLPYGINERFSGHDLIHETTSNPAPDTSSGEPEQVPADPRGATRFKPAHSSQPNSVEQPVSAEQPSLNKPIQDSVGPIQDSNSLDSHKKPTVVCPS